MKSHSYPLDNSAIIHLAAMRKNYTNGFRIVFILREFICPQTLQEALNKITPRFPTVIAGIRSGFFQYRVVPAGMAPLVKKEQACLSPMTKKEIRRCACRVLYCGNRIIMEFSHALTDGYGGMVVASTLVAEYLRLQYSTPVQAKGLVFDLEEYGTEAEFADDYLTYAGGKPLLPAHRGAYQLPRTTSPQNEVSVTSEGFLTNTILNAAHQYGVSVTTFLSAVMVSAIADVRHQHPENGQRNKPIQIMIPVDLRRMFPSRTLRNFSLFALVHIDPQNEGKPFEELLSSIKAQLACQTTKEYMGSTIGTNIKAAHFPLYTILPLPLKCAILRLAHQLFGEDNSCISLSNLGEISLPEDMSDYVEGVNFALTPRIRSPYNCGVVSFDGLLSISFSKTCAGSELEKAFWARLDSVINGVAMN